MDSISKNNKSMEISGAEIQCLKSLKDCIKENPELNSFSEFLDDKFLLHFVRGNKCDFKKALKIMKNYFHTRRSQVEFFQTLRPSTNISLKRGNLRTLKHTDHLGRLIIVNRTRLWNPYDVEVEDVFKLLVMLAEEIWNSESAEKNGVVMIFDLAGWTIAQSKACTPKVVYTGFNLLWNNIPLRYKGFHFVNENLLFSMLLKTVKLFVPAKLKQRCHVHSNNLKSLHSMVSPDILPESLGGQLNEDEAFDDEFDQRILDKENQYEHFADFIASDLKEE